MLGWPAVQAPPAAPQVTGAAVDALSGRVAAVEAKAGKPAADPAMVARIDALEKSATSLRSDIASLRAQSDKTASALNDATSAPRAAAPDLAALNDRLAQLERASKTERAELAQQSEKIAAARAMDDKPLRHVVAAALLDVAVRHGDRLRIATRRGAVAGSKAGYAEAARHLCIVRHSDAGRVEPRAPQHRAEIVPAGGSPGQRHRHRRAPSGGGVKTRPHRAHRRGRQRSRRHRRAGDGGCACATISSKHGAS